MITIVTDMGPRAARRLAELENDGRQVRIKSVSHPRQDKTVEYVFRKAG